MDEKVEGKVNKMSELVTREDHNRDIDRVHERIDKLDESALRTELAVSRIEASAGSFSSIVSKMYDTVHGKGGVRDTCFVEREKFSKKISGISTTSNIQWAILSGLVIAIIGRSVWILSQQMPLQ